MSCQKFKTGSYCVGCRHKSAAKYIYGDLTSKSSEVVIGYCSKCNGKKSLAFSDNTIHAESLGDFFKKLCKKGPHVS